MAALRRFETHEIFNQSPPFADVDLSAFGRRWGSAEFADQARLAHENPPKLETHDAKGMRRDVIEFHPAYHRFMAESMADGVHAMTWQADGTQAPPPAEVARAARLYMTNQIEPGHDCPITMTRASIAALAAAPELRAQLMPKILSRHYDRTFRPWWAKTAITLGMGMTEKQGGTDVRANTTRAVPAGDA